MRSAGQLEHRLGYVFNDTELLQRALTHRSAGKANNERLEFLGDAVLGCVIAGELYWRYPDIREGRLSRLRSSLVRKETLAEIGQQLEIGEFLRLGPGERKSGGHRRSSIIADAVEALLGAVYLDSDFEVCRQCILHLYSERLDSLSESAVLKDPKTRLQELLQSMHAPLPEYSVTEVDGKAHAQSFEVACSVVGQPATIGRGGNRRAAEQDAALRMLGQLSEDD